MLERILEGNYLEESNFTLKILHIFLYIHKSTIFGFYMFKSIYVPNLGNTEAIYGFLKAFEEGCVHLLHMQYGTKVSTDLQNRGPAIFTLKIVLRVRMDP